MIWAVHEDDCLFAIAYVAKSSWSVQFRTSSSVQGLLVAEGPVDIDPEGGFAFGTPGLVHEFKTEQPYATS